MSTHITANLLILMAKIQLKKFLKVHKCMFHKICIHCVKFHRFDKTSYNCSLFFIDSGNREIPYNSIVGIFKSLTILLTPYLFHIKGINIISS